MFDCGLSEMRHTYLLGGSRVSMKLTIARTGWILTLLPVMAGTIFVVVLFFLLTRAENELNNQLHARAIVSRANDVSKVLADQSVLLFMARESGTQSYFIAFDKLSTCIPLLLNELSALSSDDPIMSSKCKALVDSAHSVTSFLNEIRTKTNSDLAAGLALRLRGEQLISDAFGKLQSVVSSETDATMLREKAFSESRNLVVYFLLVGVAGNIVLSILLAKMFARNIGGKVAVLTTNMHNLKNERPLNPALEPDDELGQLDVQFHDMAAALQAAKEREIEINQMKQRFMQMVSHDLRTPLASIKGVLNLLSLGVVDSTTEKGKNRVLMAEKDTERLIRLVSDLLDFERLNSSSMPLNRQIVELSELLDQVISIMKDQAEEQSIELVATETSMQVEIDAERILQVVINLVANAIKFSPKDSKIWLKVIDLGSNVRLEVVDRGRGVPEEVRKLIFEPFKQTSYADASIGSGLGLAICKLIIDQHKGTIGVDSEAGVGSTFWITLPARSSQ